MITPSRLVDRARRVHPVERLVGLGVGVDGDRAVGLEQHEPIAGASRAPSRPWYSTEHRATSKRTAPSVTAERSLAFRGDVPYDEVLKELVLALGAALFLGNVLALFRRGSDAEKAKTPHGGADPAGEPGPRHRQAGQPGPRAGTRRPQRRLHGDRACRHDLGARLDHQLNPPRCTAGGAIARTSAQQISDRADGRAAVGPRARGFELRGEAEQHVLAAVARDELHADRQPVVVPVQRQRDRGLAGQVERRGEADTSAPIRPRSSTLSGASSPSRTGGSGLVGSTSTSRRPTTPTPRATTSTCRRARRRTARR